MKKRRLKALAVAIALTVTLSPMAPAKGMSGGPAITTTVEAATKKLSLKVGNKKAYVGKTTKISAKATKGAKLSYKTSNKKIAMVNSKGVITGKKAGTVKITITAKRSKYKTVKKTITVKVYRQNQKVTASNVKLTAGQRKNLGAKAHTRLAYKSSNPKVVTVDKKGNLTAKKAGTAKITVTAPANGTYNKASRTITVTVAKPTTPAKPTATPVPTATPESTKTLQPTATPDPTEAPESPEPSEELKAALDEITSKDYEVFENWINMEMVTSSPFYFVTNDSNVKGENVCRVTSSDPSTAWVVTRLDENGVPSILKMCGLSDGSQSVTLTFTLGNYVKTCKLSVVPYHELDISDKTDEELVPYVTDHPDYAREMFNLINDYREKNGCNKLEWDSSVALKQASIMAGYDVLKGLKTQNSGDFAEHGKCQIGFGYPSIGTPQMAFDGFISSPLHRANILSKSAQTIGISFMTGYYDCGIFNAKKGTSVVCTISSCTIDGLKNFTDSELTDVLMNRLELFIKSYDEFHQYESWFYHPADSKRDTDTEETLTDVGGDDLSDGDVSVNADDIITQKSVIEKERTGTEDLLSLEEDSPEEEDLPIE